MSKVRNKVKNLVHRFTGSAAVGHKLEDLEKELKSVKNSFSKLQHDLLVKVTSPPPPSALPAPPQNYETKIIFANSENPLDVLSIFEPYVDKSRELKGSGGVTPMHYLKKCAELKPLPTVQELGDSVVSVLDADSEEGRQMIKEIAYSEKAADILTAIREGLDKEDFSKVAKVLYEYIKMFCGKDIYDKKLGMALSRVSKSIDDYIPYSIVLQIAKICFSVPSSQAAFCFMIAINCGNGSLLLCSLLVAAGRIKLDCGKILEASYLADFAYSHFSSSINLIELYSDIARAAGSLNIMKNQQILLEDLSEYFCPAPFLQLSIRDFDFDSNKVLFAACGCLDWSPIMHRTDGEIWNSIQMQRVRESVLDGSYRFCSRTGCVLLRNKMLPKKNSIKDNYLLDIINNNQVILKNGPKELALQYDEHCNLKCPSCRKEFFHLNKMNIQQLNEWAENKLLPILKTGERLIISLTGEALSSPHSLHLLQQLSPNNNPNLKIQILTNGADITKEKWDCLGDARYLVDSFKISIDGTGETFEKLRYPAKWEKLLMSMALISELKNTGEIKYISVQTVVQNENYKQLKELFSLCVSWGVDILILSRIKNRTNENVDIFTQTHDVCDKFNSNHKEFLQEMTSFKQELSNKKSLGIKLPRVIFPQY